ncbi:Hypothetical predicted protein [Octopus vulgaris]|uniref:Mind bomb SH3 repeat domain-containing protein n=1 Tax=Octopus vulgaris TaxID=6645 RepID=A0AA36BVJ0_OCTVU|nr:Hypothetical predicted protein [Octopus vulgaris]
MGLSISRRKFKEDEQVKVNVDVDMLKMMQKGHGGWDPRMEDLIGQVGSVHGIYPSGDVVVEYREIRAYLTFNPDALTKVNQ